MCSEQAQAGDKAQDVPNPQIRWERQFIRYVVVGVATNGAGYLFFYLFTAVGLGPVVAISILYPIHLALSFTLNKRWSFAHQGRITMTAVKFLIAYAGCYLLNVAALSLFAEHLGFSHLIVQACAIVILAGLLFLVQRYWVFRGSGRRTAGDDVS